MTGRVKVSIDAPGVRLRFEGTTDLWEREILPLVGPVARGAWREGPVLEGDLEGPAGPQAAAAPAAAPAPPPPAAPLPSAASPFAAPATSAFAAPAPSGFAAPAPAPRPTAASVFGGPPRPAPSPAAPAAPPAAAAAAWDPTPLYARLAGEESRKGERDAVLLALVSLGAAGQRDAAPAEVVAHMVKHGFPGKDVKARPILAKLCHRKGLAVPGLLPNTFRATPAGSAYIWRRAKGG